VIHFAPSFTKSLPSSSKAAAKAKGKQVLSSRYVPTELGIYTSNQDDLSSEEERNSGSLSAQEAYGQGNASARSSSATLLHFKDPSDSSFNGGHPSLGGRPNPGNIRHGSTSSSSDDDDDDEMLPLLNARHYNDVSHYRTQWITPLPFILFSRMVLVPVICLPAVLFHPKGFSPTLTSDPMFTLSLVLVMAAPTAINLIQQCSIKGFFEQEMAMVLFWSYCVLGIPCILGWSLIGLWAAHQSRGLSVLRTKCVVRYVVPLWSRSVEISWSPVVPEIALGDRVPIPVHDLDEGRLMLHVTSIHQLSRIWAFGKAYFDGISDPQTISPRGFFEALSIPSTSRETAEEEWRDIMEQLVTSRIDVLTRVGKRLQKEWVLTRTTLDSFWSEKAVQEERETSRLSALRFGQSMQSNVHKCRLNQHLTWRNGSVDLLVKFEQFVEEQQRQEKRFSLSKDRIADLTDDGEFTRYLSDKEVELALADVPEIKLDNSDDSLFAGVFGSQQETFASMHSTLRGLDHRDD
ncbi:hypothetical protein BGZ65_010526, partial [Modicella reniformis]